MSKSICLFRDEPVVKYVGNPLPPTLISCPMCGRCDVLNFIDLVKRVEQELWKLKRPDLVVAVMGCEVNGPGEAKAADIGLAFGKGRAALFKKGSLLRTVSSESAIERLLEEIKYTW